MTYSELIKNNGASTTVKALEQRVRRMAKSKGMSVTKLRDDLYFADRHGPYMINDARNTTIVTGLELEAVLDYLAEAKAV